MSDDPSILRRSTLRELKDAVVRASDDSNMSIACRELISNAYEAAGWDRPHRQEATSALAGALLMLTAWQQDRGVGPRGEARLGALRVSVDLLTAESEESIRDLRQDHVERLLDQLKRFWDAPGVTG